MRRGISIAVLLVILTSIFAPMAQALTVAVPACCRAGGKHHCSASMGNSGPAGFKSAQEICPYRHHAALTSEQLALTATSQQLGILVLSSETVQPTESNFYSNRRNDVHKRGPPAA